MAAPALCQSPAGCPKEPEHITKLNKSVTPTLTFKMGSSVPPLPSCHKPYLTCWKQPFHFINYSLHPVYRTEWMKCVWGRHSAVQSTHLKISADCSFVWPHPFPALPATCFLSHSKKRPASPHYIEKTKDFYSSPLAYNQWGDHLSISQSNVISFRVLNRLFQNPEIADLSSVSDQSIFSVHFLFYPS